MLTYSDLMNLLLILFIILYCMSKVDAQKAYRVSMAIKQGFHATQTESVAVTAVQKTSSASLSSGAKEEESYEKLYQNIMELVKQKKLQNKIVVQVTPRGVIITLSNTILFARSSADLSSESTNIIISLGTLLKNVDFSQLVVEGFTDSDPIHTSLYKDNRDLSSERANNVARILQYRCALAPEKMSSLGYGEYRPVAPNDTPANKEKNRRVVITILKPSITADAEISADDISNALNVSSASASAKSSGN